MTSQALGGLKGFLILSRVSPRSHDTLTGLPTHGHTRSRRNSGVSRAKLMIKLVFSLNFSLSSCVSLCVYRQRLKRREREREKGDQRVFGLRTERERELKGLKI